jgi:hypothetical protein
MSARRGRRTPRPELRVEVAGLGTVDPFTLEVVEEPPGSGVYSVEDPARRGRSVALERAGLGLAGAGQALLSLSANWLASAGRGTEPGPLEQLGEVRMVIRRREARLLASLLRRHLQRLPEPPSWMPDLLLSLEQIDEFLRWEEV